MRDTARSRSGFIRVIKSHIYETFLALAILVYGSTLLRFFGSIEEASMTYPKQIAALCLFAFLLGLLASSAIDRRAALVEKVKQDGETERKRMDEEKAVKLEEAKEAERLAAITDLSPQCKAMLLFAYETGDIFKEPSPSDRFPRPFEILSVLTDFGLVSATKKANPIFANYWVVNPKTRKMIDENPDLFESLDEGAAENDAKASVRRSDRLVKAWANADALERFVAYYCYLEEFICFEDEPDRRLMYTELISYSSVNPSEYCFYLAPGVKDMFNNNPDFIEWFDELKGDADSILDSIMEQY